VEGGKLAYIREYRLITAPYCAVVFVLQVLVKGKVMPYAASQQYSLVITSGGSVQE
jgi:hypothetical protein